MTDTYDDYERRVRERAHEIWVNEGKPHGQGDAHWARAREEISVTPTELRVRRISHRGHVAEWVLNPLWVRLDQQVHEEYGVERLYLVSSGRHVAIGRFLGPDEKASFAKALNAALLAARRGVSYNPVG